MQRVTGAVADALNLASTVGVPFVGAAGIVLQNIIDACEEVKVCRGKSRQLSNKCTQILALLNERSSKMEGSEMQQLTDELYPVIESVCKRMKLYSSYNSVMTFLKNTEIKEGLNKSIAEVETAMGLFHINANVSLHATQNQILQTMHAYKAEMDELLYKILTDKSERQRVVELQRSGEHVAEQIMEAAQTELRLLRDEGVSESRLSSPSVSAPPIQDSQRYLQYQRGLIHLHRETGVLPSVKVLNGEVTRTGNFPVAGGAYSDIWVGMWLGEEKVALKALRNVKASDPKAKKRFENEVKLWANFKNGNILPFYGIVTDLGQHIHMVSPWQENGNVLEYVKARSNADRLHLIRGAALGLEYLHSKNVIHGNVKCANILVMNNGEACICDFGMAKVIEEVTEKSASATLTADGGSARWLAPELIEGKSPSKEADTYSYAMATLEMLTERHPYADIRRDAAVIHGIINLGLVPSRPDVQISLPDDLWSLMQRCWQRKSTARPSMTEVASAIKRM